MQEMSRDGSSPGWPDCCPSTDLPAAREASPPAHSRTATTGSPRVNQRQGGWDYVGGRCQQPPSPSAITTHVWAAACSGSIGEGEADSSSTSSLAPSLRGRALVLENHYNGLPEQNAPGKPVQERVPGVGLPPPAPDLAGNGSTSWSLGRMTVVVGSNVWGRRSPCSLGAVAARRQWPNHPSIIPFLGAVAS